MRLVRCRYAVDKADVTKIVKWKNINKVMENINKVMDQP